MVPEIYETYGSAAVIFPAFGILSHGFSMTSNLHIPTGSLKTEFEWTHFNVCILKWVELGPYVKHKHAITILNLGCVVTLMTMELFVWLLPNFCSH
jgi:hypothetical protein